MIQILGWLAPLIMLIYVGYGVARFHDLFSSPRYVRRPPSSGFWGPDKLFNAETWTPEGLARRNQLFAWQAGLVALLVLLAALSRASRPHAASPAAARELSERCGAGSDQA